MRSRIPLHRVVGTLDQLDVACRGGNPHAPNHRVKEERIGFHDDDIAMQFPVAIGCGNGTRRGDREHFAG